jgi:hypothetical protein
LTSGRFLKLKKIDKKGFLLRTIKYQINGDLKIPESNVKHAGNII